jgi:hypothetical protein
MYYLYLRSKTPGVYHLESDIDKVPLCQKARGNVWNTYGHETKNRPNDRCCAHCYKIARAQVREA